MFYLFPMKLLVRYSSLGHESGTLMIHLILRDFAENYFVLKLECVTNVHADMQFILLKTGLICFKELKNFK